MSKTTVKQVSKLKIVFRTIAIIMFVFGFSLTYNMPEKIYGVTWWELGAMSQGHVIKDTEAMFEYLGIDDISDLNESTLSNMETKAYDSLETSLLLACGYWFVCATLLFFHIKDKEIKIKNKQD
ncbi:MAG: hypothetical protein IJ458_03040 [Clostridia bacterium]|nr:hypothetical protein [Clostridia bacterium]